MKKHLLILFAALLPLVASAQKKVEIDGIWYKLTKGNKTAEVTYKGSSYYEYDGEYSDSINIPATVTHEGTDYSVTSIGEETFFNCRSLTAITLPEGLTSIGDWAFSYCTSLPDINIPEGVTSIGLGAFSTCSSLAAITLPESVTSIGESVFSCCPSLTAVTLPEGLTSIGEGAFSGCNLLKYINIPEGVTSIGSSTFHHCTILPPITLPEGLTSIGEYAFTGCSRRLTSITIPEGVTSIRNYAFADCSSLTAVVLPKNLKNIYLQAFANCPKLHDVYCYAEEVPSAESDAFDGSYPENVTLHVPANALNAYKSTAPWNSFGTIVELDAAITGITLDKTSATIAEGKELTLEITTTPDDADRNLISWSSSNPHVAIVNDAGRVTAVALGTATITATAYDSNGVSASCEVTVVEPSYTITYYVDGEVHHRDTLTRGSAIEPIENPIKEGHTFSGWGDIPETMPEYNLTVKGRFTVNKYVVTFKVGDKVIEARTLEYGARIVAPRAPAKEGHTFNGWGDVAERVPAYDVTYEGTYTINTYKVYYYVGTELVNTIEVAYGDSLPEYIYEPTEEDDIFCGWVGETYDTMPAHDVTYTANICSDINAMSTDKGQQTIVIYDLHGRRVTNPIKGGIYIINGRKVMIK